MVESERVRELVEAYQYYADRGIIVHPLCKPILNDHTTGKSPSFKGYSTKKEPYSEKEIMPYLKNGCNLGIVCGKASDITVLDFDWYCEGIVRYLFEGFDISQWCTQVREEGTGRGHIIFKFVPALSAYNRTFQDVGFDILSQNLIGQSSNCVCAPSIHYSGSKYRLSMDIYNRTEMPEILVTRIIHILDLYAGIKEVLKHCRAPFRKLWQAMFVDKDSELYHNSNTLFRKDIENRIRCLGMFTELKANGATIEQLLLCCKMAFGKDYVERHCLKEISLLDISKPWTNARIQQDEYLGKFYAGSVPW